MPIVSRQLGEKNFGSSEAKESHFAFVLVAICANYYLVNPRIKVRILNCRPFYVIGEVYNPGGYRPQTLPTESEIA
jgi:protein involved in polysaccharide export with SLBB domain